ncbi:amidohydrolase [Vibrio profundi]|uniref:amidohydrolase n=1 Tax=Vibrio profundi TaxID=1774960 RepID=UPI0037369481
MKPVYSLALLTSTLISPSLFANQSADVIFTNASIYNHINADTIAVNDGKIIFIGSSSNAKPFQGASTQLVDLESAFLLPGFIDNHNHVFEAASEVGGNCELNLGASLDDQIPYLKACRQSGSSNQWVMGYGFTIEALLDENNRSTPLEVIDAVFPEQPVIIMEQTSHSMWVNSVALEQAGITKNTPEPQGGRILKDAETGELNGILLDNAGDLLMEMAWNSTKDKFNASYDGLMIGLEQAAKHGITTIGDGRLYWKRGWYEVWQEAEKLEELTARVSLRPWIYPTDAMEPQLRYLEKIHTRDNSELLIVDQVKMYSDGIFVNGTAKTLAPYLTTYIPDTPYGINYIPPEQMENWLTALNKLGYSAHIHAIGDGAVRESLDAIEGLRKNGVKKPYTLTHVELVSRADIKRFESLNVTADFQVGSDYVAYHEHQWAEAFVGAKRAKAMMNLKVIFDTEANVTLSSDWNVHDINPLVGIANSLIMGKTGLPDIESSIDAYTINAAYSLGIQNITGSIEVGKSADFAILDKDITQLRVEDIPHAQTIMTVLQGDIVFNATK